MKKLKNTSTFIGLVVITFWLFNPSNFLMAKLNLDDTSKPTPTTSHVEEKTSKTKKIHLALLLDTSNSMDGLIDQAKSQLWNIVDELANAEYEGEPAELYIALYEYGNDNLSVWSNYIRQLSSFTQDLDKISTELFKLRTNGGSEFCGAVIGEAMDELNWSENDEDLRLIFIAGNEPFNQGRISFKDVCQKAADHDIQVNTIFCGNYQQGIDGLWLNGAKLGKGEYMNIDMDQKTIYVATPYDEQIDKLNDALNDTYVAYGKQGAIKKESQLQEDSNADFYSRSNKVKRTISKSKHVYKNDSWDLIDAKKQLDFDLATVKTEELPNEMKNMSLSEREAYITKKSKERKGLQKEIQELALERSSYIKHVNDSLAIENELEQAILKSVKSSASQKDFTFKE